MDIERRAGRIVGALFLAQMAGSALLNTRLEAPLFGEPGFLVNAGPYAQQFGAAGLTLAAVEHASVMSMVSLSHAYANASTGARDQFQALRGVVASARNWVHYFDRLLDGTTLLVFYLALFRFTLVPRTLAVLGLIAALLQITGIAVVFFGHDVMFPLLAPLGLAQLALSVWLLSKGFARQAHATF